MTRLLRGVIVLAFAASSALKLIDLEPTIQAASSEFHLSQILAGVLISGLILLESCLAAGILLARRRTPYYRGALLFLILATFVVVVMESMGLKNCLCFGQQIVVPPLATVAKNLALILAVAYQMHRDRSDRLVATAHESLPA
jgi:hypothetical protein